MKTASTMLPLNSSAPHFSLLNVSTGQLFNFPGNTVYIGTVIMFLCNHCPYVKHINSELVKLASHYAAKGIQFIAINSNDTEKYPEDAPEFMVKTAQDLGYEFPYLFDETQSVARAYQAACTPDFFVYNADLKLVYRGQLDDSRPGNDVPVTGHDLTAALDCLLTKRPVNSVQKPSIGCNIKWKP